MKDRGLKGVGRREGVDRIKRIKRLAKSRPNRTIIQNAARS